MREESRRAQGGHSVEEVSLTTTVSTAGLDLRYGADVDELHRRIRDTATNLCDRIDAEMRGDSLTSDRECVRHAVNDAMAQADDLVAYYRG